MENKNVPTIDTEANMEGRTGCISTHNDDFFEDCYNFCMWKGVQIDQEVEK